MYDNITRQQVSSVGKFLIETFKNDSKAHNLSCFRTKKWNWINWLPYWCNSRNMEVFMYELRKYQNTSNVVKDGTDEPWFLLYPLWLKMSYHHLHMRMPPNSSPPRRDRPYRSRFWGERFYLLKFPGADMQWGFHLNWHKEVIKHFPHTLYCAMPLTHSSSLSRLHNENLFKSLCHVCYKLHGLHSL